MKLTQEQLNALIAKGVNDAMDARAKATNPGGGTPPASAPAATQGATTTPGAAIAQAATQTQVTRVEVVDRKVEKGLKGTLFIKAMAAARGNRAEAIQFAETKYAEVYGDEMSAEIKKALTTAPISAGGAIVPPDYSTEIIGLLYNRTAVRRLGATPIPMPSGQMTLPKLSGSATAEYIGEAQDQNASQQTFGTIVMSFKKLRALVPLSNDLLRFSSPSADAIAQQDITNAFVVAEDVNFIRGAGSAVSPKGLRYWTNAAHILDLADTVDATTARPELYKCLQKLGAANIPMIKAGWILSIRTSYFLKGLQTTVGVPVFPEMTAASPNLLGLPYVETAQIPENLGGGTETELYVGDFFDAAIGESSELTIDASAEAAFRDGSGNLQSAFSQDLTVLRGIARHDFALRRDKAFVVGTAFAWGA